MTLRDALGVDARHVYERVDEVLNSEDGIILLVDRRHATSYLQGFALSGCQIELCRWSLNAQSAHSPLVSGPDTGGRVMTNRTRVTLITALTALSLNAGRVWLTGALKSVSLLAIVFLPTPKAFRGNRGSPSVSSTTISSDNSPISASHAGRDLCVP